MLKDISDLEHCLTNLDRMILCGASDDVPLTELPLKIERNVKALQSAGLLRRTMNGYRITPRGRAALRWGVVASR